MHSDGRTISRRGLLSIAGLLPAGRLFGQRHDQTFSTDVEVVQVFATVRTGKGALVRDLTKDDFKLEEDGRAQTIRYFSRESDLPLTLGVVLDTSESMRPVLDEERSASSTFFDRVLREDRDMAFVIHFDSEVEMLQDLTSSRKRLQSAWSELEVAVPRELPAPAGQRPTGGTSLYDALLLASDAVMNRPMGRKAIIVLSDGMDSHQPLHARRRDRGRPEGRCRGLYHLDRGRTAALFKVQRAAAIWGRAACPGGYPGKSSQRQRRLWSSLPGEKPAAASLNFL